MSKDAKELSPEEKFWAVKEHLSGKGSAYSIADKYGVTDTSIRRWVDRYKIDGEQAFHKKPMALSSSQKEKLRAVHEYLQGDCLYEISHGNMALEIPVSASGSQNTTPEEMLYFFQTIQRSSFKQEVIRAYLAGEGSYAELCVRYNIPSFDTVRKWVLQYNDCRTIRGSKTGGTTIITKGRKTTYVSDMECFSLLMEKFNDIYGNYSKYLVADVEYGSYNIYLYCEEHGMKKYMKFIMHKKETTDKKYHESSHCAVNFIKDKNRNLLCPNGCKFIFKRISM